jgi:hypothetical protein
MSIGAAIILCAVLLAVMFAITTAAFADNR